MKIKFKTILKAWLITSAIAAGINLIWFFVNTSKAGNPWPDVIGVVPILVMSFGSILVGAVVYWLMSVFLTKVDGWFAAGAIIITILSVSGHPTLSDGSVVPPEFRFIDIPMHFIAGLLCAFLVPAICRNRIFKRRAARQ